MTSDRHQQPAKPASRARTPGLFGGVEEIFRFGVSGGLGTLAFVFLVWLFLQLGFDDSRLDDAIRWAVPYLITSALTHTLHRRITFRWPTPYWRSLLRTYLIYGVSLSVTTLLHDQLIWTLGLGRVAAFLTNLFLSGCWNYLLLRHWGFAQAAQQGR